MNFTVSEVENFIFTSINIELFLMESAYCTRVVNFYNKVEYLVCILFLLLTYGGIEILNGILKS